MKTIPTMLEMLDKGEANLSDITINELNQLNDYVKVNRKSLEKYGNKTI